MISRAVALFALFVAAASAVAAEKEIEELLAKMRKAYSSVSSVSLMGKSKIRFGQGEQTSTYTMDWQSPLKQRLIFEFAGRTIRRISDGKTVLTWPEDPKTGEKGEPDKAKASLDGLGGDAPINLESMCFFDWKRQLSTSPGNNMEESKFKLVPAESWDGKTWIVLEESAYGQGVFARYFIDPKTFFIWRVDVKSLDKKQFVMETRLTKLTINPKLSSDLFALPKL